MKMSFPNHIKDGISDEEITLVYQLVRMAFYAIKLGASFMVEPIVVSLANEKNWSLRSLQVKLIKMGGRIVRHARHLP